MKDKKTMFHIILNALFAVFGVALFIMNYVSNGGFHWMQLFYVAYVVVGFVLSWRHYRRWREEL